MLQQITNKDWIRIGLKTVVGILFCISAIGKLATIDNFELYMFSFGVLPLNFCFVAARLIIAFELSLGVILAINIKPRTANITALSALGVFTLFLIYAIIKGRTDNCHCMGDLVNINPTFSIFKNLILAAALAFALPLRKGLHCSAWNVWSGTAIITAAIFIYSPPDNFNPYLRYDESVNRPLYDTVVNHFPELADGRRIVCLYSTSCKYCERTSTKVAALAQRHGFSDRVICIFAGNDDETDSLARAFYRRTISAEFRYIKMPVIAFLKVTNGEMPEVLLTDNGKIIKEYNYRTVSEHEIKEFFKK